MKPTVRLQRRPLAPHLRIYRLTMTMTMSILHRLTGIALYLGTLLLTWWLVSAAWSPGAYATFRLFIGSSAGEIVLLGYVWALLHHLLGGLRHFVWDMGKGFDLPAANVMARATLIGSLSLTAAIWVAGHLFGGAT
ncbi:succinate dehydrogenase, cytochrome b556 subunit [Mesorhizobium sp. PAMC28654]|uniref:succinate dehydrogenase, cytochrome b556 subunit n=1 Tax=Mesorhizobium sp. PAMC28654 TaxID=2880934 RepID=UPI001D0BC91D|nr:succinate dehydrogenase, cytochrome b556 subunit [Mesorhizobium sp. PAMC28654]UDL90671.1 succinate dehydrogenase, cytochrome b556 subunit [Mesorhizobium sp. PAMC28654]